MKIELKSYNITYTVETDYDDIEVSEYFDIFEGLLLQAGFHKQTIQNHIIELAEVYKEIEQEENIEFAEWLDSLKCSEIDTNDYDMYLRHTTKELLEIFNKKLCQI